MKTWSQQPMKKKHLTLADLRRMNLRDRALNRLLKSRTKGVLSWPEVFDHTQQCVRAAAVCVRDLYDAIKRLQSLHVNLKK